jgi:hypothetical protein
MTRLSSKQVINSKTLNMYMIEKQGFLKLFIIFLQTV